MSTNVTRKPVTDFEIKVQQNDTISTNAKGA